MCHEIKKVENSCPREPFTHQDTRSFQTKSYCRLWHTRLDQSKNRGRTKASCVMHTGHQCRDPGQCGKFKIFRTAEVLQQESLPMGAITTLFMPGMEAFLGTGHKETCQPPAPAVPASPAMPISSGQSQEVIGLSWARGRRAQGHLA